jgi:integrase
MKAKNTYKPVPRQPGIFQNIRSGRYQCRKSVKGKQHKATFDTIYDAKLWIATFNGTTSAVKKIATATLREVWTEMQERHLPLLSPSTCEIWLRRYQVLEELLEFRMEELTPTMLTGWVEKQVKHFKSEKYQNSTRGKAKRCNLDNELNLLTTIFNWYKKSEKFEHEAINLLNPVRLTHKRLGFIQPKPIKDKAISLEAALKFFCCLKPLYRDLALFQFFSASRISEAAGLQWPRVDFENRKIVIMETSRWDMSSKIFVALNPFPKNKEPRAIYMTDEIYELLKRREAFRIAGNNFVFQVEGKPLNYSTIQLNYREGQRISGIPYTGTHILRHGMAKLARKIGGGLDAVIAMTGHKDFKLADHYSKLDSEYQKEISIKIMDHIKQVSSSIEAPDEHDEDDNVLPIAKFARKK